MLKVIIVPLLISKLKEPSITANYRPYAIATIKSKVIEKILFHRLEVYLYTADNRYAWTLKTSVDYYNDAAHLCTYVSLMVGKSLLGLIIEKCF